MNAEWISAHADWDLVTIGAGAAGLMASIWAGRAAQALRHPARILALDGAKKIGLKILVAGGGRCNVTHHAVSEAAYAGGSRKTIRKVLLRFDVPETVTFFQALGVDLKREETGKLFPTTDDAHTVLGALLEALGDAGAELRYPARVTTVEALGDAADEVSRRFRIAGDWGEVFARRVILATGGKALPRSGSDGGGYRLAQALGHTLTEHIFPALVPLVLEERSLLRSLSGLTLPARIELRSGSGKRLAHFENSTLCTHFGLSGPSVMDMSRYLLEQRLHDPQAELFASWAPELSRETAQEQLQALGGRSVGRWLKGLVPERMGQAICEAAHVDPQTTGANLRRDARNRLLEMLLEMRLGVTGDRGFTHAEVTAGGVPLTEIDVKHMASRVCPGVHLCGEICDVDGRIGGFNFQWAWASGYVAGSSAMRALSETPVAER